jgi:hypothetical protein
VDKQLQKSIYISALNELNKAYDKAEKLGDSETMLKISLDMEKLINENDTNEVKLYLH